MSSQEGKQRFTDTSYRIGQVLVDPVLCLITTANGDISEISRRQILAIAELAANYGQLVSRSTMHNILCLTDEGMRDKGALSHHISIIRKAFGDSSKSPKYIKTIRSQGYFLLQQPMIDFEQTHGFRETNSQPLSGLLEKQGRQNSAKQFWRMCLVVISVGLIGLGLRQEQWQTVSIEPKSDHRVNKLSPYKTTPTSNNAVDAGSNKLLASKLKRRYVELLENDTLAPHMKAVQLLAVGRNLLYLSDWHASSLALEDSLAIQRQQFEQADPVQLAITLTSLAQLRSRLAQNIDESRDLLVEAANLMRNAPPSPTAFMKMLHIHAGLLMFDSDGLGAESLLKEALNIEHDHSEKNSQIVVSLKTGLARALAMQSKFDQALSLTEDLLSFERARLGEGDRELAPIISLHAFVLASMGRYKESAREYKKVLAIEVNHYSADHPRVLHGKSNLADSLLEAGEVTQAIKQYSDLVQFDAARDQVNAVRLGGLKLRLSNALLHASMPLKAYGEITQVASMLEGQSTVPNWMGYSLNSLHGAALVELGECDKGMRLINHAVERIFLDSESDPRVTSKIYARKAYYEASEQCT